MGGNNLWGHLRRPSANADLFPPAHFPALGPVYCSNDSSILCFPWGTFGSLTDLAVRISLPVIFLLKVLLPNLVTYSLCRAVMRNRAVGRGHLCLTYSANSPYPIFDGSASPVLPGVYHLTLLSQELHLGYVVKCLWTLEGAEWSHYLHRCSFPHLIFILNKSLKPLHERGAMIFESETVKFEWKLENNNSWYGILMLYWN